MPYTVTLKAIRAHGPCKDEWEKLLRHLGKTAAKDEPLDLLTVLDSNGLDDALWCLRALGPEHDNAARLLVCDLVEPAMQYVKPGETRPQEALRVARAFARGKATADDLAAARSAAGAAARSAAGAAGAAARAAAWAAAGVAGAAGYAAWDDAVTAARAAAWASARDAAWDATGAAAEAAWATAWAAAGYAAEAARAEQERIFRAWLAGGEG